MHCHTENKQIKLLMLQLSLASDLTDTVEVAVFELLVTDCPRCSLVLAPGTEHYAVANQK